jgi:hypothetical protein
VRVAEYIVANPIRKGLACDVSEYPWSWWRYDDRGEGPSIEGPSP